MTQGGVSELQQADSERLLCALRSALLDLAGSRVCEEDVQRTSALDLVNKFECTGQLATEMLQLSVQQVRALCSMQEYIDFMHTLAPRVWSDTAVDDHACWQQLKELAEQALSAFGWSVSGRCQTHNSAV